MHPTGQCEAVFPPVRGASMYPYVISGHFHDLSTIPTNGAGTIIHIQRKGMVRPIAIPHGSYASSASSRSVHFEGWALHGVRQQAI